jgi:predicted dehydrogenase
MVEAVKRYRVVFQTGSQQRSDSNFRRACELVRNGRIGTLHTVKCGLPGGTPDLNGKGSQTKPAAVPNGFNYDLWLGPAPYEPYCPARCHVNFRWVLDYSGGQLTDWGGHHPDIAQWGMNTDRTGPVKIQNARATWAVHPVWNSAMDYYFECIYANGVKLIVSDELKRGVTFEGSEGAVWANRGIHDAWPKSLLQEYIGPDEIHLYRSDHHIKNFIDCVLSRREPVAPAEVGHRSISIAHLGNIAMTLGRDLQWNPEREQFIGDAEADRMLSRPQRSPWHL